MDDETKNQFEERLKAVFETGGDIKKFILKEFEEKYWADPEWEEIERLMLEGDPSKQKPLGFLCADYQGTKVTREWRKAELTPETLEAARNAPFPAPPPLIGRVTKRSMEQMAEGKTLYTRDLYWYSFDSARNTWKEVPPAPKPKQIARTPLNTIKMPPGQRQPGRR